MKAMVIGVVHGKYVDKSGKEKESTNVFYQVPFSDYESKRDGFVCSGFKTGDAYIAKDIDVIAGDTVLLDFQPSSFANGGAQLVDIVVSEKAKSQPVAQTQAK